MSIIGSEILASDGRKILVNKVIASSVHGDLVAALEDQPYEPMVMVEGWVVSAKTNKTTSRRASATVPLKDLDEFDCQQARLGIDYQIALAEQNIRRLKERRLEFYPGEMGWVLKDGTTATNIDMARRRIKAQADEMMEQLTRGE